MSQSEPFSRTLRRAAAAQLPAVIDIDNVLTDNPGQAQAHRDLWQYLQDAGVAEDLADAPDNIFLAPFTCYRCNRQILPWFDACPNCGDGCQHTARIRYTEAGTDTKHEGCRNCGRIIPPAPNGSEVEAGK